MVWRILLLLTLATAQSEPLPRAGTPTRDATFDKLVDALLLDTSYKVRLQAAVLLGRTRDARASAPLLTALSRDTHPSVRAACSMSLVALGEMRGINPMVHRMALDPDPLVRHHAEQALSQYPADLTVPYLIATYNSQDAAVRLQVVRILTHSQAAGRDSVLVTGLGDTPEIYAAVSEAVGAMSAEQRTRFFSLAVEHRNPLVRIGALRMLNTQDTREAAELILKVFERDIEVDEVRTVARQALRDVRSLLPMAEIAERAIHGGDQRARARPIKLLGAVGGELAYSTLTQALLDDDVYIRGITVMALKELGDPDICSRLETLAHDPANLRILPLIRNTLAELENK